MVSIEKAASVITTMIPAVLTIAVIVGCRNVESPKESHITVKQRQAAVNASMEFLDSGKFIEALAIIEVLIDKDPTSSETQESYGLVLLACAAEADRSGDVDQATDKRLQSLYAYKAACKTATKPGLLYLSTGQLAHMLDRADEAKHYYELSHKSNPDDSRSAFFISQIYLLDKNWNDARYWIQQSLIRDKHEPYSLLTFALIEAELGNAKKAKELAQTGCAIRPTDSNLRLFQARVLRITGETEHALAILSALPEPFLLSPVAIEEIELCKLAIEEGTQ